MSKSRFQVQNLTKSCALTAGGRCYVAERVAGWGSFIKHFSGIVGEMEP